MMQLVELVLSLVVISTIIFSSSPSHFADGRLTPDSLRLLSRPHGRSKGGASSPGGTTWAVLVAGSNGFENYRHQADVCHAYQILKKGGIKDENIVVFMFDDIASNSDNPRRGVIINNPKGPDVYHGVPKDYTGDDVTASNLIAVLLGDKKSVKGGSGKVVDSGPNDHVFIYYTDHGSPGLLGMPVGGDLYANDLVDALKKKHASKAYSRMVVYVEACFSGSIFDGILPTGMNIYVTTASSPDESSYATYCPDDIGDSSFPKEYDTCLGDLYSVAWMEDSDRKNPETETLGAQYRQVKKRTISATDGSHVMQYGDFKNMSSDVLGLYIGSPSHHKHPHLGAGDARPTPLVAVDQREADIVYLQQKVRRALEGSEKKAEAQQELDEALAHRNRVDQSIATIGQVLFGAKDGMKVLEEVRPEGQPLVDDWDCLKSLVGRYEAECGGLATYGKKYMRAFANICNDGVHQDRMAQALSQACNT